MEDIYTLTEAEETYGEALEILAKYHKAINKKPISWASFLVLHEIRYEVFYCEGNYLDWSEGRVSYLQELVSKEDLESFMYTQIDNYDEEEGIEEKLLIGKCERCKYKTFDDFWSDIDFQQVCLINKEAIKISLSEEKLDQYRKIIIDNEEIIPSEIKLIPCEIRDNLPLNLFEENISKAREEFFEDLDDSEIQNPEEDENIPNSKIEFFNENFLDILYYMQETFEGTYYFEKIAFGTGSTINQVKERLFDIYEDRFNLQESFDNEELLTEIQHQLSTQLWPEGREAAEAWAIKVNENTDDKNFAIFAKSMEKFHLKEIRGTHILDSIKELPEEEKSRIVKKARETCKWFI